MSVFNKHRSVIGLKAIYNRPGMGLLTLLIILIGAALVVLFLLPQGQRVDKNGYQVVYMASGQAYFGKLQNTNGDYLVLKQPYTVQDVAPEGEATPANVQASTTLLKVSQQAYGPEDVLSLSRDQVLFWQNLRADSKVVKAIESKQ